MAGGLIEAVWLEMFRLGSTAGNRQHSSLAGAGMSKKKKKKFFCQKTGWQLVWPLGKSLGSFSSLWIRPALTEDIAPVSVISAMCKRPSRFSGFLEQRMGRGVGLRLQLVLFLIVSDGCCQTLP